MSASAPKSSASATAPPGARYRLSAVDDERELAEEQKRLRVERLKGTREREKAKAAEARQAYLAHKDSELREKLAVEEERKRQERDTEKQLLQEQLRLRAEAIGLAHREALEMRAREEKRRMEERIVAAARAQEEQARFDDARGVILRKMEKATKKLTDYKKWRAKADCMVEKQREKLARDTAYTLSNMPPSLHPFDVEEAVKRQSHSSRRLTSAELEASYVFKFSHLPKRPEQSSFFEAVKAMNQSNKAKKWESHARLQADKLADFRGHEAVKKELLKKEKKKLESVLAKLDELDRRHKLEVSKQYKAQGSEIHLLAAAASSPLKKRTASASPLNGRAPASSSVSASASTSATAPAPLISAKAQREQEEAEAALAFQQLAKQRYKERMLAEQQETMRAEQEGRQREKDRQHQQHHQQHQQHSQMFHSSGGPGGGGDASMFYADGSLLNLNASSSSSSQSISNLTNSSLVDGPNDIGGGLFNANLNTKVLNSSLPDPPLPNRQVKAARASRSMDARDPASSSSALLDVTGVDASSRSTIRDDVNLTAPAMEYQLGLQVAQRMYQRGGRPGTGPDDMDVDREGEMSVDGSGVADVTRMNNSDIAVMVQALMRQQQAALVKEKEKEKKDKQKPGAGAAKQGKEEKENKVTPSSLSASSSAGVADAGVVTVKDFIEGGDDDDDDDDGEGAGEGGEPMTGISNRSSVQHVRSAVTGLSAPVSAGSPIEPPSQLQSSPVYRKKARSALAAAEAFRERELYGLEGRGSDEDVDEDDDDEDDDAAATELSSAERSMKSIDAILSSLLGVRFGEEADGYVSMTRPQPIGSQSAGGSVNGNSNVYGPVTDTGGGGGGVGGGGGGLERPSRLARQLLQQKKHQNLKEFIQSRSRSRQPADPEVTWDDTHADAEGSAERGGVGLMDDSDSSLTDEDGYRNSSNSRATRDRSGVLLYTKDDAGKRRIEAMTGATAVKGGRGTRDTRQYSSILSSSFSTSAGSLPPSSRRSVAWEIPSSSPSSSSTSFTSSSSSDDSIASTSAGLLYDSRPRSAHISAQTSLPLKSVPHGGAPVTDGVSSAPSSSRSARDYAWEVPANERPSMKPVAPSPAWPPQSSSITSSRHTRHTSGGSGSFGGIDASNLLSPLPLPLDSVSPRFPSASRLASGPFSSSKGKSKSRAVTSSAFSGGGGSDAFSETETATDEYHLAEDPSSGRSLAYAVPRFSFPPHAGADADAFTDADTTGASTSSSLMSSFSASSSAGLDSSRTGTASELSSYRSTSTGAGAGSGLSSNRTVIMGRVEVPGGGKGSSGSAPTVLGEEDADTGIETGRGSFTAHNLTVSSGNTSFSGLSSSASSSLMPTPLSSAREPGLGGR